MADVKEISMCSHESEKCKKKCNAMIFDRL